MPQASADIPADSLIARSRLPLRRRPIGVLVVATLAGLCLAGSAVLTIRGADDPLATAATPPAPAAVPSATARVTGAAEAAGHELATAAAVAMKPLESVVEVMIRRNDTLDSVFRRLSLPLEDLAAVRNLPGVRQSLDILKPGDVVKLTSLNGELTSLTRRLSDTDTLSVTRAAGGDFAASIVKNALDVRIVPLRGRITSSLFRTIDELGASDQVALQLAEVFRYDIDFAQELQPGDSFTIVLEKVWRNGEFLRDGDILAAEFVNNGRVYRALRYTLPDGRREYYTPEGKSLRKAFLLAPVQFSRISSGFGLRWHPVLNRIRAHRGIDYAAPIGTPIRAAGAGRVAFRGAQGGYGNVIMLSHPGGIETVYGHLSRFAPSLVVGKRVQQGDLIGYVGMSGLATGPHLHYEYRVGGVHRNPATIKSLPAEPIPPALRADFETRIQPLVASLEAAAQSPVLTAAR